MRAVTGFDDFELIDATDGERLERWKDIILIRPDPQVMWHEKRKNPLWNNAHAKYHRSQNGGGHWEMLKPMPKQWNVDFKDLTFHLKPMDFKHTGLFPEQAVNWDLMREAVTKANRPVKVLNLFAYTGGATIACLKAGASVTHVDASKGMVLWAKENAVLSGVSDRPVRWLQDDCLKFIAREIRRGNKYDGIVMDPPSYGRGPNGEVWKIEQQLDELLTLTSQILSDDPVFFLLNSYSGGISPSIVNYMVQKTIIKGRGEVTTDEIGLKITDRDFVLPCGCTTKWTI